MSFYHQVGLGDDQKTIKQLVDNILTTQSLAGLGHTNMSQTYDASVGRNKNVFFSYLLPYRTTEKSVIYKGETCEIPLLTLEFDNLPSNSYGDLDWIVLGKWFEDIYEDGTTGLKQQYKEFADRIVDSSKVSADKAVDRYRKTLKATIQKQFNAEDIKGNLSYIVDELIDQSETDELSEFSKDIKSIYNKGNRNNFDLRHLQFYATGPIIFNDDFSIRTAYATIKNDFLSSLKPVFDQYGINLRSHGDLIQKCKEDIKVFVQQC